MMNIKMRAIVITLLVSLFLVACGQKEEAPTTAPPESSNLPDIPGFDLSVVQPVDYYRAHLDGAKKLAQWCRTNIKQGGTAGIDPKLATLMHNCQNASYAEFSPKKSVKEGKTYKSYD